MKFPLVYAVFQMEVPKKETAEEKEERIEEYGEDSRKAYSYLVEACTNSPVAMGIVLNHAATDETCWANTLLKRLTARFTLQASTRLQNLIGEFNILTVAPEETGALFMDRYNAKVAAISAIDIKQLPTKLSRLNVLKTAIKSAFPILFAVMTLKETEANNIEALEDKFAQLITEWNQENELGKKAQQESAAVAQFTQFTETFSKKNGLLKKAFLKKQHSGRGEELKEIRRCYRCNSEDHLQRDCPENDEESGKRKIDHEETRSIRDGSSAEKKRNKKSHFPLKSALKKNKEKKSERRFISLRM
jgi:Zinc knuckle